MIASISLHRLRLELGRVIFWHERGLLHLYAAPRLSLSYATARGE